MRKYLLFLFFVVSFFNALCQSGGTYAFQSLHLINNARTAALGGYNVSLADKDGSQFVQNPALMDSVSHGTFTFLFNPFFAQINAFTTQYVDSLPKIGSIGFNLTYLDYGKFNFTDPSGNDLGKFGGRDFLFTIGKSHRLGPFVMGINLKYVYSGIASYHSSALLFDVGGMYTHPVSQFSVGMVVSNVGFSFQSSTKKIPLQVTLGFSYKPEGMPVRFTVTGHNFAEKNDNFYEVEKKSNVVDAVFKRMAIGAEILIHPHVNLLVGYDHNKKQELRLATASRLSGFSFGVMLNIKKFIFRFSHSLYYMNSGTSYFSIQKNLRDFEKIF